MESRRKRSKRREREAVFCWHRASRHCQDDGPCQRIISPTHVLARLWPAVLVRLGETWSALSRRGAGDLASRRLGVDHVWAAAGGGHQQEQQPRTRGAKKPSGQAAKLPSCYRRWAIRNVIERREIRCLAARPRRESDGARSGELSSPSSPAAMGACGSAKGWRCGRPLQADVL